MKRSPVVTPAPAPGYVENPDDANYAAAARAALEKDDLRLAVEQISAAIALRPDHEAHLALLDRIVGRAKGPLLLVALPSSDPTFFGLCAARARVLARLGRVDDAIEHLLRATAFSPSTPFLPWAEPWVRPAKDARAISPTRLASGVITIANALRTDEELDAGARSNLEAALTVVKRVRDFASADPVLAVAESRVLRALRRTPAALAALDGGLDWAIAVERASILRELGRREEEMAELTNAAAARPSEPSTYLDLGDALLAAGRPSDACVRYDQALALDATSEWARISGDYASALVEASSTATPLRVPPSGVAGRALDARARSIHADLSAYASRLADPHDPIVGVLRAVASSAADTPEDRPLLIRLRTERPIAPSAHVAFGLMLAGLGRRGRLVGSHAAPAVAGRLWRSTEEGAIAALARPSADVLATVRSLACAPFDWTGWLTLADQLALNLADPEALVAAMAHPPDAPPGMDVTKWVHAFQVAAAVLLARAPIPAAARRASLVGVLDAVDDWSAAAALLGLRALPDRGSEVVSELQRLVPLESEPLAPSSRALAVVGCELASGAARRVFVALRVRVMRDFASSLELGAGPTADGRTFGRLFARG